MRIRATCDSCFNELSVDEKHVGKRVKCPECGEGVRISEGGSEGSSRKSIKKPKGRKQESNQTGLLIGVGAVAVVAVIAVVGLLVMNSKTTQVAGPAAPMPTMTGPPMTTPGTTDPSMVPRLVQGPQTPNAAHSPPGTGNLTTTSAPTAQNAPGIAGANPGTLATTAANSTEKTPETSAPAKKREKMELVDLIALVEPSVVRIKVTGLKGASIGSGFVVDKNGTVVTNVHVMAGAKEAEVEFSNGTKSRVVGFYSADPKKDIAIIKIDTAADKLVPMPMAKALPQKGLSVIAFGSPHGLSFTTSEGIVSALRPAEEMKETFGVDFEGDWVQTSTPISPGNSGGPLVNYYGEVVAMNTMQLTTGQNLNFAMSSMDIVDAVSKAPSELKPITVGAIQTMSTSRSRSMASDETETERGTRLLAELEEIFLLNATSRKTVALDATGRIWDKVILKSKSAVEKSKVELSDGEPSDDAAIMFVILELKTSKKKTATAGTQELHIKAELICQDPKAKPDESRICRIWMAEENLGTISINALMNGSFPQAAESKLSSFFTRFRTAFTKARQVVKKDDDSGEKSKKSGSKDK